MKRSWPHSRSSAFLGAGFLLLLALVTGGPVLTGHGLGYLDNPAHLAEALDMARPDWNGWSDLAFCGFPLGQWHSPLAYGALAAVGRLGLPLTWAYRLALAAGFLFPPLILFAGARRRLGAFRAALLASLLLLQPPAIVGIESALGGMWTFHLAAGALLWLMQRWSAGRGSAWGDAALIGLIGLTHLFVLAALPLLAVLALAFPSRRKTWTAIVGAALVGAMASAAFWLPAALAQTAGSWSPQNLSAGRLLWALAVPADLQTLTGSAPVAWRDAFQPGLLPMLALLALGIAGGLRRPPPADPRPARLGWRFAVATLAVLLLLPLLPAGLDRLWGPVSWRFLHLVRLGLAWSAVDALASIPPAAPRPLRNGIPALAALLMLGLGWLVAAPLRQAVRDPGGQAEQEIHALWAVLRESAAEQPGRVYLQDTYGNPDAPAGLARHSHALAFTAAATGVRQVGAYYGMAPQPTARWTAAEFGRLCGVAPGDPDAVALVRARLRQADCSRLVTASAAWTERLAGQDGFHPEYRGEWLTLFRIEPGDRPGNLHARVDDLQPGVIRVNLDAAEPGQTLLLATAWHPHWRLDAPDGVRARPDESGLIRLDGLPAGPASLVLRFRPPAWPRWISVFAWAALVLAAARRFGRWRWPAVAACGLLLAVYLLGFLTLPRGVFYSPDSGGKYLQMLGTRWDNGLRSDILHPAAALDPDLRFYPSHAAAESKNTTYPVRDPSGQIRTGWTPWFSLLAWPLHRAGGLAGLHLLPWLAGLALLAATKRLADLLRPGAGWPAALAVGLASPVLFYSLCFWEHTLAAALALAALEPWVRASAGPTLHRPPLLPALGSTLLGLAACALRRELVLFGVAAVLAWTARHPRRRQLLPAALGLLLLAAAAGILLLRFHPARLYWLFPASVSDIGWLQSLQTPDLWRQALPNLIRLLLLKDFHSLLPLPARIAGLTGLALCLGQFAAPVRWRRALVLAGAALLGAASGWLAFTPLRYRALSSLLLASPLAALALLPIPAPLSAARRGLAWMLGGFVALLALLLPAADVVHGGLEWGSRYALPAIVLLNILAVVSVAATRSTPGLSRTVKRTTSALAALLILLGAALSARGVLELRHTRRDLLALQHTIESINAPVVTPVWWLTACLAPFAATHEIHTLSNAHPLDKWLDAIAPHRPRFVLVGHLPPDAFSKAHRDRWQQRELPPRAGQPITLYERME